MNAARQWPADHVERRQTTSLLPYARNPRTHSDAQIAQIAASIREFGWTIPVLIAEDGTIIAGHARVLAANLLGIDQLPVMTAIGWTDAQKRAYLIVDNQLSLNSAWDFELLAEEIGELRALDFDMSLLGLDASTFDLIDDALGIPAEDNTRDEDAIPDIGAVSVSVTGDVWQCGKHRLICGNAADQRTVELLMQGDEAQLCFTSPPYLNQRDYKDPARDWNQLMGGVFATLPMTADGQVLVNLGLVHQDGELVPYWDDWIQWMRSQGWRRFAQYVWDQGPGMPGDHRGRLAPAFELIFHFNRQLRKPNKIVPCTHAGEFFHRNRPASGMRRKDGTVGAWTQQSAPTQEKRIPDSVIRIPRQLARDPGIDHPAMFPVALAAFVMEAYSNAGELVYEPFSGSGSVMIAAEKTGRLARCIEIAPAYVDVSVKRWQAYTGCAAINERTGESFDLSSAREV